MIREEETEQSMQYTLESEIYNHSVYDLLGEYSSLHCSLLRKLYNEVFFSGVISGCRQNELKREYISGIGIKGRHFNSLLIEAKGMYGSQKQLVKVNRETLKSKLSKIGRGLLRKGISGGWRAKLLRDKQRLEHKLSVVDKLKPVVFGTKKLYKEQFSKPEYVSDHGKWLSEWRSKRNGHVFLVGSSDEKYGNSLCQMQDLSSIRITLPDLIIQKLNLSSKHIDLDVRFFHEKEKKNQRYMLLKQAIDESQAITFRLIKRNNKWYVQASFNLTKSCNQPYYGNIGIDYNHELIQCCTVKPDGNKHQLGFFSYTFNSKDTSEQQEQKLSDISTKIVELAKQYHLSLTIENLNLEQKKKESTYKHNNKILNSMPYIKFKNILYSKCLRNGIRMKIRNPAYTSIIGAYKYSKKLGRSVHSTAALCIARRGLNLKDLVPNALIPLLHSGDLKKHHWAQWAKIKGEVNRFLKKNSLFNLDWSRELTPSSPTSCLRSKKESSNHTLAFSPLL